MVKYMLVVFDENSQINIFNENSIMFCINEDNVITYLFTIENMFIYAWYYMKKKDKIN